MRFSVGNFTTKWQRLEQGIMAGCTISVVLFIAAMNLLITRAERKCRGPLTDNKDRYPSFRAFMDDLSVTTQSQAGTRWILKALEDLATWARLQFKPQKSRSLVIHKGNTVHHSFILQQTKNWSFEHGIIPRIRWPFTMYDFPMSKVEQMEHAANRYLRKWLGVLPSFSSVNLYSKTAKLTLPITSTVEECKAMKAGAVMSLQLSNDYKVQQADKTISCAKKWDPKQAVSDAEVKLRHNDIVGVVCKGRSCLGNYETVHWKTANPKEKRHLVVQQIRQTEEDKRLVKAVGMAQQGAWPDGNQQWIEIQSERSLSFLLRSVSDLLPMQTNLQLWGKKRTHLVSDVGKHV